MHTNSTTSPVCILLDIHSSSFSHHIAVIIREWRWHWNPHNLLWRLGLLDKPLIHLSIELFLKPINHVLERVMVLMVEEVASWFYFDELTYHNIVFLRNISHDDILRVLFRNSKPIWNSCGIHFFFYH